MSRGGRWPVFAYVLALVGGLWLSLDALDKIEVYYERAELTERNQFGQDLSRPRPCSVDCD